MMEAGNDIVLQEDLDNIASADLPYEEFEGKTVFVTGASGYIGSVLCRALLCVARRRGIELTILGLIRSREKALRVFGPAADRPELEFVIGDVRDGAAFVRAAAADYVVHTASVTASKQMVSHPIETILTAVDGTVNALERAAIGGARFLYVSSMEVYGSVDPPVGGSAPPVTEDMLGRIDLANVRSGYPESKRLCELLCASYGSERGLDYRVARLAQVFGAGVPASDGRVFAQFARSAMEGRDIVLHTTGASEGNYCYVRDAVKGLLSILLKGETGGAYNVVNEASHTTIAGMARMVADEVAGGRIKVVFDIPASSLAHGYAPDVKLRLSGSKLEALGWRPEVGLKESYERMMRSMRVSENER
jgi:nucleoside-diphosphate-sugar epimerase